MAIVENSAPLRNRGRFVKIRQIASTLFQWPGRETKPVVPGLKQVNDHLARDIGLSPSELELARHKWPSQTTRHPRG